MRRLPIFVVWFALAGAILVIGGNLVSPGFHRCLNKEWAENSAKSDEEKRSKPILIFSSQSICTLRLMDTHNGFFAAMAAIAVAFFTYTLWGATEALVRTERDKRSAIGGGGEKIRGGSASVFTIIATNAGPGSAVLRRLRWGFGDLGTLPPTPVYAQDIQTGEPLFPGQKQPVRHARMFTEGYRNPVIFFRFDYYDINRRREASAGFVLIIDSPDFPALSIPTVDVPPAYLADNFPLGT